ncbi:AAA family ATPase [Zavarzinella formosa]|uniref:AAA family ATPase n=1 Tax=Zavarzinella formosa TaxID=360055 RepID=UPI001930D986|nr:AAA family ATPase [Zavarzinella formosa]
MRLTLAHSPKVPPLHPDQTASMLRKQVTDPLKARFVGRAEVIDLIALAIVAGEHLFLYGPPGTAKSAVIRAFAQAVDGRYFEYLLTRFSEPNEVFGPIDLIKLREGLVATVTDGMLPEAEFAFLDELFNANSAILNNLLTVLNERLFRRGRETLRLPLLSLFSASNHLPEDDALGALFDRFLLRCKVDALPRESMPRLLEAGWALEHHVAATMNEVRLTAEDLRRLSIRVMDVDLDDVREQYAEMVFRVRDLGVGFSDRRAVKALKLVAASAVLSGRAAANASDLWVFRHVWDREEQIAPLHSLVLGALRENPADKPHVQAVVPERVDPEALAKELAELGGRAAPNASLAELARLREQLNRLHDRLVWVTDEAARQHLAGEIMAVRKRIG